MVIFLQKKLNEKQKAYLSLCKIYGIGLSYGEYLCKKIGLNTELSLKYVLPNDYRTWRKCVSEERLVGSLLQRDVSKNIKQSVSLRNFKGVRHFDGMPVRGQNTKSNARTAKRLVGKNLK